MAKKDENITPGMVNAREQRQKAIGNPNKNNHAKKKNSNYGGYRATQIKEEKGKPQTPRWISRTLTVLILVMIILLILQFSVFKESDIFTYINSTYMALVMGFMFYTRNDTYAREPSKMSTFISFIIGAGALLYLYTGVLGLYKFFVKG